ncbi:MAG: glycine cleavage system protein R [Actinomycetota bacterium]
MSGRSIAITVIGNDRPGIVAGVTEVLFEQGCNLEDVTSTILRGHFSMVLIVQPSGSRTADDLEEALSPVADRLGLVVTARPVEDVETQIASPTHMVSVYGADKPGIGYRVAQALADAGANVTDLTSRVIGEPDAPVYALMMEVAAEGLDIARVISEATSGLGVDASVHPIEADVL